MKSKDIHALAKQTEITINGIKLTLDRIHPLVLKSEAQLPNDELKTDNDAKIIQKLLAEEAKKENKELSELIDEYVRVTQSEL